MKKLVQEYSFTEGQLNIVRSLARQLRLTETTVRLLYARGVDTAEKIEKFLSPSKKHFLSPFLMSGMQDGVDLLYRARNEGWNVVVFGDYDADGICASSIMHYALKRFGVEHKIYIPERNDGYGLSVSAIDRIFEECVPDLFMTVDCGISNYKEVEYLKERGVRVVITDHHELPPVLPDCILINPKIADGYPYDNLCGAGVAFKVACALLGEQAYDLLDFAALATVADSVPLLGENRDIVYEGLKAINSCPREAFRCLLSTCKKEVMAHTLAFTVAPRINAAGRMGDAASALALFMSEDEREIYDLAVKLNDYNTQRQTQCDLLYESAKKKIREKGAYGNVILLSDENWSGGFVGIVAARIAEEYCRPTILFVQKGDMLKGSARSIESINIFEALRACDDCIAEFGGHAQAAGVNVCVSELARLEERLNEYIGRTYTAEDFIPKLPVSGEITETVSLELAHELNRLEPYGVGHRKPLFYLSAGALPTRPFKAKSPHLSIRTNYVELVYFNSAKYAKLIESDVRKKIVFECEIDSYRGKESVRGNVREIVYDGASSTVPAWSFSTRLLRLQRTDVAQRKDLIPLTHAETEALILRKRAESAYGLCLIASEKETIARYECLKNDLPDLIYPAGRNVGNVLLFSPAPDADLSDYRDIVFLDDPTDLALSGLCGKTCYYNSEIDGLGRISRLDARREKLLEVFSAVRAGAGSLDGGDAEETAVLHNGLGFSVEECMFALSVFEELGLIDYESGCLTVYRGVHADLGESELYTRVLKLQRGEK